MTIFSLCVFGERYAQAPEDDKQGLLAVFFIGAFVLAGLIIALLVAVVGRNDLTWAARRKRSFYRYVRRMFTDPNGSWYHGHQERNVRKYTLEEFRKRLKGTQKHIGVLEKFMQKDYEDKHVDQMDLEHLRKEALLMQSVIKRMEAIEKIVDMHAKVGAAAEGKGVELVEMQESKGSMLEKKKLYRVPPTNPVYRTPTVLCAPIDNA